MSFLRSLSITSAARSSTSSLMPCAMRPSVPMLHGMTTIASNGFEPLANGTFMLFSPCCTAPAGSRSPAGNSSASTACA